MSRYVCWIPEDEDEPGTAPAECNVVAAVDAGDAAEEYAERVYYDSGEPFTEVVVAVRDAAGQAHRFAVQVEYQPTFSAQEVTT